jgi:cytidylate kinase
MIITIDGRAGTGKSSTAKSVARTLAFRHLDSGAFYRALTHAALHAGIPIERWDGLSPRDLDALAVNASVREGAIRFSMGGEDITDSLRSVEVDRAVSRMARVPAVRGWLMERLRAVAGSTDLVADGRDMGTVVFPDAQLKVFLTCDDRVRARRRLLEREGSEPTAAEVADEVARLTERDRVDMERTASPLRQPDDAVVIDTTDLTMAEQIGRIVTLARAAGGGRTA